MARELRALQRATPPWLPADARSEATLLADGFHGYQWTGPMRRAELVRDTVAQVERWQGLLNATRIPGAGAPLVHDTGGQRTKAWLALREGLLTASSFGNALGFWDAKGLLETWARARRRCAARCALG